MNQLHFTTIVFIALLLVAFLVGVSQPGIAEPEVCNYNAICTPDETDNCIDCQDVLGRDIVLVTKNFDP